jgi:hypothetical protein
MNHFRPFGAGYVSEFDQFIDTYLTQHPEVLKDQQRSDTVPEKPYHYD